MLMRFLIATVILLFIDWYFFQALKTVFEGLSYGKRTAIYIGYWMITVMGIAFAFSINSLPSIGPFKAVKLYGISIVVMFLICKVLGLLPILIDDIIRLIKWLVQLCISQHGAIEGSNTISRSVFLNRLALITAAIPMGAFVYGMIRGAFNYQVSKKKLVFPNLPGNFKGLKIVQISDLHVGSFISDKPLQRAVEIINEQRADIIFFTGDLVNNLAAEAEPFMSTLSAINAPLGVYSILGNHDYGHYTKWKSEDERLKNVERLKQIHAEMGWKLLINENEVIEKNGDKMAVIGIENWSAVMNFPKYGDMAKAVKGLDGVPIKLLLSHDPSHWKAEVTQQFKDIDLTLSGHTHGMQFGIDIPGIKWSPVQYVYKQWAGLYKEGEQYLYVNKGLGFIGYMGRVGISPEITVFELDSV